MRDTLNEPGLQKALGRYLKILDGKALPHYLICKRIMVERPNNIEDAWEIHKNALAEFVSLKKLDMDELIKTEPFSYNLINLKVYIGEELTKECCFCERRCGVNRREKIGNCGVGYDSKIACAFEHIGEEPELVPSGTIFFSGCNFHCKYCQNWDISQFPIAGSVWLPDKIAEWIEREYGLVKNINFVGGEPTPNLHNILSVLLICNAPLPMIWNSNMYMSKEAMCLLYGIVDIYLADFKYGNNKCCEELSLAKNFFEIVSRNHLLAKEHAELLIRHLVLPSHTECCSKPILNWILKNLDNNARVNIMSQYRPEYKAYEIPSIARRISREEYKDVVEYAQKIGLWNIELQMTI